MVQIRAPFLRMLLACTALALAVSARSALAQPVRPNILLVFDTSGSMLEVVNQKRYDGSPLCSDNGTESRMYRLKNALRDTFAHVGIDEANFGLARFPQKEDRSRQPVCPEGYTYQDDSTKVAGDGGCKVSSHTNQTSYGPWFDTDLNQFLLVDVTRKPQGLFPKAADFDPPGGNIGRIVPWLNHTESLSGDPELRARDGYFTPLGRSIFYARAYFEGHVKPNDPKAGCRENVVILVTDGDETCDEDAPDNWNDETCTGTNYSEFHPRVQACRMFREAGIRTFVLTDTGTGAANDDIARAGGTGKAIRVVFTDTTAVKTALLGVIAETVPPPETCDGKDNDCDGLTDEEPLPGVGSQCSCPGLGEDMVGVGACKKGVTACRRSAGIACEGCVAPAPETCNGLDDNCNREIDEGYALGLLCNNDQQGVCRRLGATRCAPDGSGTICDIESAAMPGTEVCNGLDDDCDGMTDERDGATPLPGEGVECGVSLDMCTAGTIVCEAGQLVCKQAAIDVPEACNGVDDNCNGLVDEKLDGGACACPGFDLTTLMTGECKPGRAVCKGRVPLDCVDCLGPGVEVCDGKDNDCDGMTDEDDGVCAAGRVCVEGKCALACRDGEFACPIGFECVRDMAKPYCRSAKCIDVVCPRGELCDPGTGTCKDPCGGVSCPDGLHCFEGECVDCYESGCPDGQVCQAGRCELNKCANAASRCAPGEYCNGAGDCVPLCPMSCPAGHRCTDQGCVPDLCAPVICKAGELCNPADGSCIPDLCALRTCPGQVCVRTTGQCADNPCASMACPREGCFQCAVTVDGQGICIVDQQCQANRVEKRVRASGAGCACALGDPRSQGSSGGAVVLGLGLAVVGLLRRRRR